MGYLVGYFGRSFVFLLMFFFSGGASFVHAAPLLTQAKQGEVLFFPITTAIGGLPRGKFLEASIPFFKKSEKEYFTILGIDMAQSPGVYPLEVVWDGCDDCPMARYEIEVISSSFGTQTLSLPKGMVDLDPPALARVEREKKQLQSVFVGRLGQKLWDGSFIVPVQGKILNTFGFKRILNGQVRNQHSGEDIGAPMGTPVLATNRGKVVVIGEFYFNGHSVIVDHGFGFFTMYFHLLSIAVTEGQIVERGEILGQVGQSGRATGPHLHWGAKLNGARINPFALLSLP